MNNATMKAPAGWVARCANGTLCAVHSIEGRAAVPCSTLLPTYEIPTEPGLTFNELVERYERHLLSEAFERNDGRVLETAAALGMSRQTLSRMINERHRVLEPKVRARAVGRRGHRGKTKLYPQGLSNEQAE